MSEPRTIKELRAVTQPESVRGRANSEHWVADLYLRRISPYLTRILLRFNFTPNAVTWLMIVTGLAAGTSLLIPGILGVTLALVLGQVQMLLDCCDGEVARWTKRYSPVGIFLDKLGHYVTESSIAISLGLRLAGWPERDLNETSFPLIGGILAVFILLNKSVNDFVHVSRYFAGLPKLEDRKSNSTSRIKVISLGKNIFRYIPIHRAFHSVEMTCVIFVLSVIDLISNLNLLESIFRWIVPIIFVVFLGHLVSILTSNKLRASD